MKIFLYSVLFAFVLFIGCGKKDDATNKTDTKTTDITTKNGNEVSTGRMPAGFPQDIPIYKNAPLLESSKTGKMFSTTFDTSDPAKDVGDYYKSEMPKNGYKPDAENERMSKDDRGIITFTKEGRICEITYRFNDAKGMTTVSMLIR